MSLKTPRGTGAVMWFFQRLSGVALVVMLGLHFVAQHFVTNTPDGVVTFQTVTARLSDPLYKAFGLVLLLLSVIHALNGVWMVTEDYVHTGWKRMIIWSALVMLGVGLFAIAAATILPNHTA